MEWLDLIPHEVGDILKVLGVVGDEFQAMLKRSCRDHEVKGAFPRVLALTLERGADFRTAPCDCRRNRENLGGAEKALKRRLVRSGSAFSITP